MTSQPMEANVVLTADTSQYDASLQQSANATEQFAKGLDSVTKKLNDLSKWGGKKLLGFAAADMAAITGATTAYAAFEKQMESLQAQAAVLNKDMDVQKRTFTEYTAAVNSLRSAYGTSTREATALVQVLSKVGDNTRGITQLADTFTRLGNATGESSAALAQSMLQLQRTMGTPQRDTEKYANTLTSLAAKTNTSAQGILEFANQIAPVGRMIGMTQNEITGVSTAFIKAGQDGYTAGNAFNKIVSDIAYATQTGSPDLAKYANLVGVTVGQFKEMDKTEAVTKIFDTLNRQGPAAITTLNRLGLDGMRTMRAITAMSQQTGGIGAAIAQANGADPNAMTRGSKAATDGLFDSLKRLRSEVTMTAEAFGENFAPYADKFVTGIEKMASAVRSLMSGPIGDMASTLAGLAAPLAAIGGLAMTAAAPLATMALIRQVGRGSLGYGIREGRRGGGRIDVGQGNNMRIGDRIADRGAFGQRWAYNAGIMASNLLPAARQQPSLASRALYTATGGMYGAPRTHGPISRIAGAAGSTAGWAARMIGDTYSPMWWGVPGKMGLNDPTQRVRWFNAQRLSDYAAIGRMNDAWRNLGQGPGGVATQAAATGMSGRFSALMSGQSLPKTLDDFRARLGPMAGQVNMQQLITQANAGLAGTASSMRIPEASDKLAKAFRTLSLESQSAARGMGGFSRGMGSLVSSLAMAGAGAARQGVGLLGKGLGALGMSGPMLGIMGAFGGYMAYDAMRDKTVGKTEDLTGSLDPYLQASGRTGLPTYAGQWENKKPEVTTMSRANRVTRRDKNVARHSDHFLSQQSLKGLSKEETAEYLSTQYDIIRNDPAAIQEMKLDLIDKFDASTAEQIMRDLREGDVVDGAALRSAMNQPNRYKVFGPSNEAVGKKLSYAQSMRDERVDLVWSKYGDRAADIERGRGMAAMVGGFTREGGTRAGVAQDRFRLDFGGLGFGNKTGFDKFTDEQEEFARHLQDAYGWQSFDVEDLMRAAPQMGKAKTDQERFIALAEHSIFAPDKRGDTGISEDDRKRLLSDLGLNTDLRGQKAIDAIRKKIGEDYTKGGELDTTDPLIRRIGKIPGAEGLMELPSIAKALESPDDVNLQITAIKDLLSAVKDAGNDAPKVQRIMGEIQALVQDPSNPLYGFAAGAEARNAQYRGYEIAAMNPMQQFRARTTDYVTAMSITPTGAEARQKQEAATGEYMDYLEGQRQYFTQLLIQKREFEIQQQRGQDDFDKQRRRMDYDYELQRARAQEDFHLQRQYQEEDYQRGRSRAEFDFELQRERASENYHRSLKRQRHDFNLSRRRQEEDFHHQVELMTEQAAKNMYNVYERVSVQRTQSAGYSLFNMQDQLNRMQEQSSQLDQLRGMGLSDNAIQQLGLTDPKNAQQLSRFIGDVTENPEMIQQFNRAVAKRLKAAGKLVTDESSTEWQEFNRSHRLARTRAMADFERSVRRSRQDFRRNMGQMEEDFRRSMSRQADDYERSQDRQQEAFSKSMARSAEDYATAVSRMVTDFGTSMTRAQRDLARAAKGISGNLEDILTTSANKLSGHAQRQAKTILRELGDLKKDTRPVAVEIMTMLADVFGVDYTAPKGTSGGGGRSGRTPGATAAHESKLKGDSSPTGRQPWSTWDTGGGGGGRAAATAPLPAGTYTTGYNDYGSQNSRYAKGYHTGDDYSAAAGTPILAALSGTVASAGWGGAYGNLVVLDHGGGLQTYYAHQSNIGVKPGEKVNAGQRIGAVGNTGQSFGDHLHFEVRMNGVDVDPDTLGRLAKSQMSAASILKDRYPKLERMAARLSGANIFDEGDFSGIINKFAARAIKKMEKATGVDLSNPTGDPGHQDIPSNVKSNVSLGQKLARAYGWDKGPQWNALVELWMRESGWKHTADNPTSSAYGIPQALIDMHQMPRGYYDSKVGSGRNTQGIGGDPRVQIGWGLNYIRNSGNFHDPLSALKFHDANNWYAEGSIFSGPQVIGVGERGPEAVLPLDRKGVDFLATLMDRLSVGQAGRSARTAGYQQPVVCNHSTSYQIDRSTTFSGPITVQANNPNELITQLRTRERAAALTRPSVGGRRVP